MQVEIFVRMFTPMGGDCPTNGEEWHTSDLSLLSTFSYAFPTRAESATFLFAAMVGVRYASCDFLAKSYKADIAHRPIVRHRSLCDMHLVILWPIVNHNPSKERFQKHTLIMHTFIL